MSTITKTYTDTSGPSSYRKTWTVTYAYNDLTVSGSSFTFTTPTITAKFTGTKGLYRHTEVFGNFKIGNTWAHGSSYDYWDYLTPDGWFNFTKGSSGTSFTITKRDTFPSGVELDKHTSTLTTSDFFTASNKTSKTLNVVFYYGLHLLTSSSSNGIDNECGYEKQDTTSTVTVGTITLNAPPTATYTVDTSGPYYGGAGSFIGSNYDVSVSYEAQYDGDVTSVKLQVGDNIDEFNPNNTSGQGHLSIYTTQTGPFTPILTITDTRGQIRKINLPSITVQPYESPTLDYSMQRVNDQGQPADEGTYVRINTNLTYFNMENNHILEPTVVIKDGDTTLTTTNTWHTANGNLIDNWSTITTPAEVYAIVSKSNGFAIDKSYNVSVTLTDTNDVSSQTISQVLSTAFYMIDFRAGGHGMAIGKLADKNGLEVQLPTMIGKGLSTPLTQTEDIDIEKNQLVIGKYNKIVPNAAFIIGNGTTDNDRHNIMEVSTNGDLITASMVGQIIMYAGPIIQTITNNIITSTAPAGYLLCDGSIILIENYPELFAVLGTTYGGDGTDTFGLPDFRGRVGIGTGNGTATGHTDHALGTKGGNENQIVPYHKHSVSAVTDGITGGSHDHGSGTFATNSKGSHAHEPSNTNYQFLAVASSGASVGRHTVGTSGTTDHQYVWSESALARYGATESAGAHTHDVTGTSGTRTHKHDLPSHNTEYTPSSDNRTGANMQPYIGINYIICTGKLF